MLTGHSGLDEGRTVVQGSDEWWKFANSEMRTKNCISIAYNPLQFEVAKVQQALQKTLCSKHQPQADAWLGLFAQCHRVAASADRNANALMEGSRRPAHFCEMCGVTVGLQQCQRCKAVCYCCREHQAAHWNTHKGPCREAARGAKARMQEARSEVD